MPCQPPVSGAENAKDILLEQMENAKRWNDCIISHNAWLGCADNLIKDNYLAAPVAKTGPDHYLALSKISPNT